VKEVRSASSADAKAIAEIYRPYVEETAISFEAVPPSAEEFKARIEDTLQKFPWLVYESGGEILGYAYAGAHRTRCAYEWSVECTVYVKKDAHGRGIGKELYQALFKILKDQGAVNIIAGISLPNAASVGLHESLGFQKVANFKDVGFKLGQWWDVGYWQLQIQRPVQPTPLKMANEI
jgi:phosphinothricin acetyltransferase